MKIIFLLLSILTLNFSPVETTLTKEERDFAANYMKETKEIFLKEINGLSEAQLNFKTSPEKWSIAQCIEHIAIAETALMLAVQEKLKEPADPARHATVKATDQDVIKTVTDRSRKSTAPEFLQPKDDKFKSIDDAIKSFIQQRDKNIAYVMSTNDDLRNHYGAHAILGPIDTYQVVLLIAAHSRRHTLQIEEVKADPNFPKK